MSDNAVEPLVSVVIPCLNRAHYLEPTIQSVLQQNYPNIECIVIDGGSTDGTLEILHLYDGKIHWVSEPDKSHADAINKGWARSHGSILTWLNADDVWVVPNAVSKAVDYLQSHPEVDVVYGDCGSIDDKGNIVGMAYLHEWDLGYAVEFCDHCIPQPASFIRRDVLERIGWLDTDFNFKKDHELWLRIGSVGKIQHVPMLLANARNIKGLSFEGEKVAKACVKLTEKFYSLPNVPPALQRRKRRALSNSYLRGISYAFLGGHHWSLISSYAIKAIKTDPSNIVYIAKYLALVPLGPVFERFSRSKKFMYSKGRS